VSVFGEETAIVGECRFWFVSQAHQRFFAAAFTTSSENVLDLSGRHSPGARVARILSKRAITATVPAKVRYGEKNFSGVSNGAALELIPQSCGIIQKGVYVSIIAIDEAVCLFGTHDTE